MSPIDRTQVLSLTLLISLSINCPMSTLHCISQLQLPIWSKDPQCTVYLHNPSTNPRYGIHHIMLCTKTQCSPTVQYSMLYCDFIFSFVFPTRVHVCICDCLSLLWVDIQQFLSLSLCVMSNQMFTSQDDYILFQFKWFALNVMICVRLYTIFMIIENHVQKWFQYREIWTIQLQYGNKAITQCITHNKLTHNIL